MGKQAPAAPDFTGAARETAQQGALLNRPNQRNAFGSSTQYTTGPGGQVEMTQGFGGPFAGLASSLQGQAAQAGENPLDFGQFGELGTGDTARQQAIDAAYGQSTSRLNPMFEQREEALRSRLINQGIPEGSAAFNNAMGNFGRERADAFQGALNSAIGQGTQAGQAVFGQNLAARQQGITEALRRRTQPLQELQTLQGFLQQPGVQQVAGPNLLGATQAGAQYGLEAFNASNRANADLAGGIMDLLKSVGGVAALSDERAKEDVHRLPVEALPGVPVATWVYRREFEPSGRRYLGVVAQDLEAAGFGHLVLTGPDGMKRVNYRRLHEERHA